jgi:hypothetical protein
MSARSLDWPILANSELSDAAEKIQSALLEASRDKPGDVIDIKPELPHAGNTLRRKAA